MWQSLVGAGFRAVGRSENPGVPVVIRWAKSVPPGWNRVNWSVKIWVCHGTPGTPRDDRPVKFMVIIISYFQSFIGYWWPPGWFFKKQTFAPTLGRKDCIMQLLELSTVSVSLISKKADQDTVPHFFILSLFLKTWLFWEHFIGWNKMYTTPKTNSATSWWLQLLQ